MKKLIFIFLIKGKHEIVNIKDLFKFLFIYIYNFILFYLYFFCFEFKNTKELEEN